MLTILVSLAVGAVVGGALRLSGAIHSTAAAILPGLLAMLVTLAIVVFCLTLPSRRVAFGSMPTRMLQLVLHYDGTNFSGWQRQPDRRTVRHHPIGDAERWHERHVMFQ